MISLIGTRPALVVGRHRILRYDTLWLGAAVRRAAAAAGRRDFPFADDIRLGIEKYLDGSCPHPQLELEELFSRVRQLLSRIGCESVAAHLRTVAPPITLSLAHYALEAGNGFELAFFARLKAELAGLREVGAEEIRFTGLREAAQALCGAATWNPACDALLLEIHQFLGSMESDPRDARCSRPLRPGFRPDR